jgi:hypothetical protein
VLFFQVSKSVTDGSSVTSRAAAVAAPERGDYKIGQKGKDVTGAASTSFLARNGLAYAGSVTGEPARIPIAKHFNG